MADKTAPFPKRRAGEPPALVPGAMNFASRTPAPEAERVVRRALERGVVYFDTANSYNAGQSEVILGRALGRDREKVILSSKCGLGVDVATTGGGQSDPSPRSSLRTGREGLSPEAMRKALPASLERMGTDY